MLWNWRALRTWWYQMKRHPASLKKRITTLSHCFVYHIWCRLREQHRGKYSLERNLYKRGSTISAKLRMMCLTKIDYFCNQEVISADDYVDRFKIQVSDRVACEMSHAINNIEQNTYFGPKRDGLLSTGHEVIELVSLDVLHEQSVTLLEFCLYSIIFRYKIRSTSLHFRHNIFLVVKFVLVLFFKLRFQFFNCNDFLFLLVIFKVTGTVGWVDEDHLCFG